MKLFTSIIRTGRRRRALHGSVPKRPRRGFASTFSGLEGRAMLSVMGPVMVTVPPLSATTAELVESTMATPQTITIGHNLNGTAPIWGGPSGPDHDSNSNRPGSPRRVVDPVALSVARVMVDGRSTPEFALADFETSQVIVRLGFNGSSVTLGSSSGVDHPASVTLADINNDGVPDLIVANTNGNNVLVFPGLGDGQFGPDINNGQGFAVGNAPVSVSVNEIDGDPTRTQLIVSNKGSDTVSILDGQAMADGGWTTTSMETIATPSQPVKALLYDFNQDGNPDLLVCDSGTGEVTIYTGQGDGSYSSIARATISVGTDPEAMLIGQFDRRPGPDLVTVNAGSNDLTFVANVFGPNQTSQTISSEGNSPDAAFAIDPGHNGVLDLIVANGGDGRMAVFQGGNDGLQLAGVITQSNVPSPTALAPESWDGRSLNFFAASAGSDAATLLQFDLGIASSFLPVSSSGSAIAEGDGELLAQLMPLGESSLDLIAILWAGGSEFEAISEASNLHESTTVTTRYSPTEGQESEPPQHLVEDLNPPTTSPDQPPAARSLANSPFYRFVSGLEAALGAPQGFLGAIAARDSEDAGDRHVEGLARLDPDVEITSGLPNEIIRLDRTESKAPVADEIPPVEIETFPGLEPLRPGFDGADAETSAQPIESVPLLSSALVFSTQLILKARHPRPLRFRRFVSSKHDRDPGHRPDPL